jgi:hypothetical protein
LHQTEKKDQEFLVGNALFQLECFALWVTETGPALCKIVCEMHAAQLLTALSSPNAQQTDSFCVVATFKINGIYGQRYEMTTTQVIWKQTFDSILSTSVGQKF